MIAPLAGQDGKAFETGTHERLVSDLVRRPQGFTLAVSRWSGLSLSVIDEPKRVQTASGIPAIAQIS